MTNGIGISRQYLFNGAADQPRRRNSVSFGASVAWLLYVIVLLYIRAFLFDEDDSVYYFKVVPMMIIMFYQLYYLLKDVDVRRFKLNLVCVYCLFIALHYLLLRSGLERLLDLSVVISCILLYKKYPLKKKDISKLYYVFAVTVFIIILNGATIENMADTSKFNPNVCAIFLMLLFCASLVMFANQKKIVFLIVSAVCFALQFYFTSRGALAGSVLFFVAFVFFKAWKRACKVRTAFILILSLSVLGLLVAYFYSTILFEAIGKGNVTILGKDLFTGRQRIWQLTFESIKENLWFGVGSRVNEDTVLAEGNGIYRNSHNMALAVLASFGLLHFILFYLLFSHLIATSGAFNTRRGKYISGAPIVFIFAITLMNYFEALFFSYWAVPMIMVAYEIICNCKPQRRKKSYLTVSAKKVTVG